MTPADPQFIADLAPHGASLHEAAIKVITSKDAKIASMEQVLKQLPGAIPTSVTLDRDWVTIGRANDLSEEAKQQLLSVLIQLKPWRKGPFRLFGIEIDTEWDSALKWNRVAPHMAPLTDRRILDVGSSNGYYLFRMAADKPRVVLGIEPYLAYHFQYLALKHFLDLPHIHSLPLKLEALPDMPGWYDTIFCMGILYHRRSPLDCLIRLKQLLAPGGQLVLETLIVHGDTPTALCPRDRYACMRNVYFIPTVTCLESWLISCGFDHVRCVDISKTTLQEQRKTDWIDSNSLDAFLDPKDDTRTREGYPAPVRAVIIAETQ